MKLIQANTQFGVTFPVNEFEDADVLLLVQEPTKLTRITDCMNADRRQKKALVEARYDLASRIASGDEEAKIVGLGFLRKMETVKKDDVEVEIPAETEVEFFKRFIDALVTGEFAPDGFSLPSGDNKVKEKAALAFLQTLASERTYTLDLEQTVRKGGSGLIPKWAMETAKNIIAANLAEKSRNKHLAGYTNGSGYVIAPIVCDELQHAPSHATADEKEKVHQANIKAVAKWCHAAQKQENEQKAARGVQDFA
jgi:preprotein translocase subunit YajC